MYFKALNCCESHGSIPYSRYLLLSPYGDVVEDGTPVEEVEDNDGHNDGDCGHCHHKCQVDS